MKKLTYRFESFGGIIEIDNPPLLAFVDRNYMRGLKLGESPLWTPQGGEKPGPAHLSAPIEVHFSVTNHCPLQCSHCYMDSGKKLPGELSTEKFKKALDVLSEMKVFHLALGGGESFGREDFMELAHYAREKNIVPNLTTNGYYINDKIAKECKVFGQVNVSIDGISPKETSGAREAGSFSIAQKAIDSLKKARIRTGINCVISKRNFSRLEEIAAYAKRKKLQDVEFLRIKPAGRGKRHYGEMKLSNEENIKLYPLLLKLSKKYGINIKIDCSFVPMLCYHKPSKKEMEMFSVYGCEAGNVLLGIEADGTVHGCSFLKPASINVFDLKKKWDTSGELKKLRDWDKKAPAPCNKCEYLDLCKGGCHAVAEFVTGDFYAPDPECPIVVETTKKGRKKT